MRARAALRISASAVVAAGISAVFGSSAGTDHLCRDVTAARQQTLGNEASISINVDDSATQVFAGYQAAQGRRGGWAALVVPFRRIEAPDTYPTRLATQSEGVAVQDLADPCFQDGCFLGSSHPALKEKQTNPDGHCHEISMRYWRRSLKL